MQDVPTLFEYQRPHFNRLLSSLRLHRVGIDTSTTGSGKTIVAIKLSQRLNLPLMVVCPKGLIEKWTRECDFNRCRPFDIVSTDSFKLQSSKYTTVQEYETARGSTGINVTVTDSMPKVPIMLVIDEVHQNKNGSNRGIAMAAISHHVRQYGGYIHIMSATMADKDVHASYIFNMLGITQTSGMSHHSPGSARDIYNFTNTVLQREGKTIPRDIKHDDPKELFLLVAPIVRSNMLFRSPKEDAKNMFFRVSEDDAMRIGREIETAISILTDKPGFAAITGQLMNIEGLKAGVFERAARRVLEQNKNAKVLIFLNFLNSIDLVQSMLQQYNPLVLTGEVPHNKRDDIVDKFNRADTAYRVLIANPEVGGTGYDLDDKDGRFPRTSFISPSYKTSVIIQTIGRTCRASTKSLSTIRMLYVIGCELELAMLDSIAQKSRTIEDFSNNHHIIYPSSYDSVDQNNMPYNYLRGEDAVIESSTVHPIPTIIDISEY